MAIEYKCVNKKKPQDPTAPAKVYALAVHPRTFNLKKLASELAGRSTTASELPYPGQMLSCLGQMLSCLGQRSSYLGQRPPCLG